jgi:hypothetical protein
VNQQDSEAHFRWLALRFTCGPRIVEPESRVYRPFAKFGPSAFVRRRRGLGVCPSLLPRPGDTGFQFSFFSALGFAGGLGLPVCCLVCNFCCCASCFCATC